MNSDSTMESGIREINTDYAETADVTESLRLRVEDSINFTSIRLIDSNQNPSTQENKTENFTSTCTGTKFLIENIYTNIAS